MPYEQHIAKQMANKPLLFSRCLLRTQKLSESRSEGEIIEPSDEGTEMLRTCFLRSTCFSCVKSLLVLFSECTMYNVKTKTSNDMTDKIIYK